MFYYFAELIFWFQKMKKKKSQYFFCEQIQYLINRHWYALLKLLIDVFVSIGIISNMIRLLNLISYFEKKATAVD